MDKQREIEKAKITCNLELSLGIIESDKATTSPIFDEQRTQRPPSPDPSYSFSRAEYTGYDDDDDERTQRPIENLLEFQRKLDSQHYDENPKLMSKHCQLHKDRLAHQEQEKRRRLSEKRPYDQMKEDYPNSSNYWKKLKNVNTIIDRENKKFEKVVLDDEGTKEVSLRINNKKLVLGNNDNGIRIEKNSLQEFVANGGLEKVPNLTNNVPKPNNLSTDQTALLEAHMKKARVVVRTRSEAPAISDGCSWRKYGEKFPKGSPHPKAYFRCTMFTKCPARKKVQKSAEDGTIMITTYEGKHNHSLPPPAIMMAKVTSLVARMILTDSESIAEELNTIFPGLSNMATLAPSPHFPTINLDLTNLPNHNPIQQNPPPQTKPNLTSLISQSMLSGLQTSTPTLQDQNAAPLQSLDQNAASNDINLNAIKSALVTDPNFTTALATAVVSLISIGIDTLKQNNSVQGNASSNGTVTSDHHANNGNN